MDPADRRLPPTRAELHGGPRRLETVVRRRYLKLVVVLGALMAIGPLTIDTYLPALPQLSADAPFILQGRYGLSPQQFGLAFSANAFGLIVMSQLDRVGDDRPGRGPRAGLGNR